MKALEKEVMKPLQDRIIKGLEKKDLMKKGKMQPYLGSGLAESWRQGDLQR